MEIWQAIVLGMVQGFTEFLPVSSSAHLLLIQKWFGIEGGVWFFNIMLHLGTLIPVIVVLWNQIMDKFKKPFKKFGFWCIASIPVGIVGLTIELSGIEFDEIFLSNIWLISITFLLTSAELVFAERYSKSKEMINPINLKTSFIMGMGQACAIFPGLSRSGTIVTAGCLARVEKSENASFTFIMNIPVIVAAALFEGISGISQGFDLDFITIAFGVVSAMVAGYIAVNLMLKVIKKSNYKWFSLYLFVMAIINLIVAI